MNSIIRQLNVKPMISLLNIKRLHYVDLARYILKTLIQFIIQNHAVYNTYLNFLIQQDTKVSESKIEITNDKIESDKLDMPDTDSNKLDEVLKFILM